MQSGVHPLARPEYDRGPVPDSFLAERTLLLLNRPPAREAALREFLANVHRRDSPTYHQWLGPEEFGRRFGPSDADVQKVTRWLNSQGLRVTGTGKGRQFLEFSGTAAQLRNAFRAEIHEYRVNGEIHHANAAAISLPAALAPLVRGIAQMHDFHAKPLVHTAGAALYSPVTKQSIPLWTIPNPFGGTNANAFPLAPEDFATQYDLAPLYQAGINGTGQTIGIINVSNIDLSLVAAYQQLFGLPSNPPQVVVDGDDPGTLAGADVEAYLDVEVSGAVAPNATVNLYVAKAGGLQDPLALAAIRAIEDNQVSVLSVSFGQCEQNLGNGGNQFWSSLWQQAAAQGQTVLVSSGDFGAYCVPFFATPKVNGLASTPWNVAVGGTDFYYSDYATGGASANTLWNQTNDSHLGSLKAPLPEQGWSDPFGLNILDGRAAHEIFAGGGGPSTCNVQDASTNTCTGGYAKPSWQSGPGVPADGVRDTPDVSLFASNGANLSAYPICAAAGDCISPAGSPSTIFLVGGTSASSPAMAGIMALINQKYGRQGQANFRLYQLAQQKPAAFHDITVGGIFDICDVNFPGCTAGISDLYPAASGYDLATGLGTVDANVLVNDWNSITLNPTATTLTLSAAKITHGAPVTVNSSVAPVSGSGTPTGNVAILTAVTIPGNQAQTSLTLSGGKGSASINYFPGGNYNVTSAYHGDGTFAGSTSTPVALQVAPENSNANFLLLSGLAPSPAIIANGGSVPYNDPLTLTVQPTGVSAAAGKTDGNATGSVTFKVDSTTVTVPLNSTGVAAWAPPALSPGAHTASATYSGDASFNASTGSPVTFTVTQGQVILGERLIGPYGTLGFGPTLYAGTSLTVGVTAQGGNTFAANPGEIPLGTAAPTGTVQVCLSTAPNFTVPTCAVNAPYVQTTSLTAVSGTKAFLSLGSVTFPNLTASSNSYTLVLIYSGDSNWGSYGLTVLSPISIATLPAVAATTTTVSISPTSFSGSQLATISATVTGSGNPGTAPSGELDFFADGTFVTYFLLSSTAAGTSQTVSFPINANSFPNSGANSLVAVYHGDSANNPSMSNTANFTAIQTGGDFTLVPQQPQVTVQAGSSGSVGLNLRSLSSFNGNVSLSCLPSSSQVTCSVSPSSAALNGTATANLTVTAAAGAASVRAPNKTSLPLMLGLFLPALFSLLRPGKTRRIVPVSFLLAALLTLPACGGSGQGGGTKVLPPPKSHSAYSVLVVATSDNGAIHNARISVVVQ